MSFTEGVVQDGLTRWYKAQTGNQEKYFDDYSGLKTSVDSVGFIGSTPVIIEFKGYVRTNWVYYAEHRGGSLEDKITRALRALCRIRRCLALKPPHGGFSVQADAFAQSMKYGYSGNSLLANKNSRSSRYQTDGRPAISFLTARPMQPAPATTSRH